MADLLKQQKKYDEAIQLHYKALDIRKKQLGEDDPEVLGAYSKIGDIYQEQGKFDEALDCY